MASEPQTPACGAPSPGGSLPCARPPHPPEIGHWWFHESALDVEASDQHHHHTPKI
jgi:hypothetical protein